MRGLFAVEGRFSAVGWGGLLSKYMLSSDLKLSDRSFSVLCTHAQKVYIKPRFEPSQECSRVPSVRVFLSSPPFYLMCVECVPAEIVDLTPRDHEHFFRVIGGRRCNTLNPRYVMPADEDELRVRSRDLLLAFRSTIRGLSSMIKFCSARAPFHPPALRSPSQDDPVRVRE
jgi:hypothetical protein